MYDPIARGLAQLDLEAPKKDVQIQLDPLDPRKRVYVVPTGHGRQQVVHAGPVADPLFRERLDLVSISVRDFQADQHLLTGLLCVARDLRRARLCLTDRHAPHLAVAASFLPDELSDGAGVRLLHALREVAAVADSIEAQLTGIDEH
jgi:hypothetical protein